MAHKGRIPRSFNKRKFGERLKKLRKSLNHTQVEMAENLHVQQGYYSQIENGKFEVGAQFLFQLYLQFQPYYRYLLFGPVSGIGSRAHPSDEKTNEQESAITQLQEQIAEYREDTHRLESLISRIQSLLGEGLTLIKEHSK